MDYWSCLDSMTMEQDELDVTGKKVASFQMRQYGHSQYGGMSSSSASANGLLLFSPMHADSADGNVMAHRVSRSASPHNGWAGYDPRFGHEDDVDEDDDEFSLSACGYHLDHVQQHPLESSSSTPSAKSDKSSTRPPIYFPPDAARNASAVVPMTAS